MLDNIELNITNAKKYVEKGEKELIAAKEHHKDSRKVKYFVPKYLLI